MLNNVPRHCHPYKKHKGNTPLCLSYARSPGTPGHVTWQHFPLLQCQQSPMRLQPLSVHRPCSGLFSSRSYPMVCCMPPDLAVPFFPTTCIPAPGDFLDTFWMFCCGYSLAHGCKNHEGPGARANEYSMVVRTTEGSAERNLLPVTLPASTLLKWFVDVWQIFGTLICDISQMGCWRRDAFSNNQVKLNIYQCRQTVERAASAYHLFWACSQNYEATVSFVMSVRLSAWNKSSPTARITWNLIFEFFSKICYGNSSFIKIWQEQRVGLLHIKTSVHIWYLAEFSVEWEMFQTKVVEKIKTHCIFNKCFP